MTIFSLLLSKIRIRIGEWDFSSTSEPHKNVERKVTKKIVHPDYNFFTYENDLALLKLEKRVTFQDNIIPICLPANDDLLVGKCAFTVPAMIHTYYLDQWPMVRDKVVFFMMGKIYLQ